jgi:hypothetical protein
MEGIVRDDVPVAIQDDHIEVRLQQVGDMTMSFIRLKKGTDLTAAVKGLPGDQCQCPHWGYMLKGRLAMRTDHGDDVYQAGEAFYWPPGHVPIALEDSEYVDFSPTEAFAPVIRHLTGGKVDLARQSPHVAHGR